MLFERVFIGLYETDADRFGEVGFFDVMNPPPRRGRPREMLGFDGLVNEIVATYDARNKPMFVWADGSEEAPEAPEVPEEELF